MQQYNWIIENRELLKLALNAILFLICFIIVIKTHRIFKLSEHNGIRYFRNAFLFYGLAFVARYFLSADCFSIIHFAITPLLAIALWIIYEFLFVMAGFFLLYSLLWKRLGGRSSSLFNVPIFILYALAMIIAILDFFWLGYDIMFFSQIIVFSFAGGIAFEKYGANLEGTGFLKLYLSVILLMLLTRIIHFFVSSAFEWNTLGIITVYSLEIFTFLLFLYGIIKVTQE